MHDNGKQFTSKIFKHFLTQNHIRDKRIPNSYPQLQGKIDELKVKTFILVTLLFSNGKHNYDHYRLVGSDRVGLTVLTTPTISATSNNATSTNTSQQVVDQPHFKADLRGIQQFSPNTNASGEAYFRVLDDENIAYVVDVRNISRVSSAFIVYWDGIFPDKMIVPLRLASLEGIAAPGEVASGTAEGTFGVADFSERGPVERSIGDFVKHALDGNIYLKISTVQTPLGEIAGKLVPQVQ